MLVKVRFRGSRVKRTWYLGAGDKRARACMRSVKKRGPLKVRTAAKRMMQCAAYNHTRGKHPGAGESALQGEQGKAHWAAGCW